MDPITKEEFLADLVQHIHLKEALSLKELGYYYRSSIASTSDLPPLQTLLAELVVRGQISERKFRINGGPVKYLYFAPYCLAETQLLQDEMKERLQYRPKDFDKLPPEQQWAWDKALGILDYRGE
jgi:hypothetical protein